jgi:signal transduction histidine kinase
MMPFTLLYRSWNLFMRTCIAPHAQDEDARRTEYILNIILVASAAAFFLFEGLIVLHALLSGHPHTGLPLDRISLFPFFFLFLLALSRRGHPTAASYLFIGALLLGNATAGCLWGEDLPITLIAYAFIISTAGILLGTRAGLIVTLTTAGLIAGIASLHFYHIVIADTHDSDEDDLIMFGAFYALIMTVSWLSNREIGKSLARARASERALTKERDLLEERVAARTEELRRLQFEELQKVHRLAEFGRLSSGLFHDLLNILNALSLRTEGNAEDAGSLDAAYTTTRQIQQFMRAVQDQLGNDDAACSMMLEDIVEQAIGLVDYKAHKEGVTIAYVREGDRPSLFTGVPFKFHHIAINLLMNAIDAYRGIPRQPGKKRIVVRTFARKGIFTIAVNDKGCGISEDARDRIFTPFFTTKTGGAGIGLATVKKMVEEDFSGTIAVRSAPRSGTTFTVTFPLKGTTASLRESPLVIPSRELLERMIPSAIMEA